MSLNNFISSNEEIKKGVIFGVLSDTNLGPYLNEVHHELFNQFIKLLPIVLVM